MTIDVFRSLFNKPAPDVRTRERAVLVGPRIPRHSSGWSALLKHLKSEQSLRVLDVGPTSHSNVNFITGLGHSLYMADAVTEAFAGDWSRPVRDADSDAVSASEFDSERFLEHNLNFEGRLFDVVLLWTTLDYLPEELIAPLVARLYESMPPGGRLLAFFHSKLTSPETTFYRYHVTDSDQVEMQEADRFPVQRVYTNRSIEKIFSAYRNCKFFLAKDNVYEVIITR